MQCRRMETEYIVNDQDSLPAFNMTLVAEPSVFARSTRYGAPLVIKGHNPKNLKYLKTQNTKKTNAKAAQAAQAAQASY